MKIGYDASVIWGQGGIDRYARELMRYVVRLDTRNDYVVLTRDRTLNKVNEIVTDGEAHGVGSKGHVEVRSGLQHELLLGPYLVPITRMLQRRVWHKQMQDVDLVHFTSQGRWLPPVKRYVVTVHDLFPLTMPNIVTPREREEFERNLDVLVADASMLLTPSAYVRETVIERYPQMKERIRVTPLAAGDEFRPTSMTPELLQRLNITSDTKYLLFVGRVDERKNIDAMMQAFLAIPEAERRGTVFVLGLSGVTKAIEEFKIKYATALRSASLRVIYRLNTADIIMLLSSARAPLFSTLAEGFGLPVLEAMRCGCAVLTSNVSSMPEVSGDAALLVNPLDVDDIRAGMVRMIHDDTLVEDLRVRGLTRAQEFSWENTARLTIDAYEEAMQ